MSEPPPWQPWHRRAWAVVNGSSAPLWLLMILLPRAAVTRAALQRAPLLQPLLAAAYGGFLAASAAGGGERIDFRDGESVVRGLSHPAGMLAGWTHYIAFDLFVGLWIHRTGLEEGINTRVALLLTWWFGPLGLALFAWQRRRAALPGTAGSGAEEVG